MPLPRPHPGLVICYEFLWGYEHRQGATDGSKKRPCVVVLAVKDKMGATRVLVAPITHSEPGPDDTGVEVPRRVKDHLGLDHAQSWVIATDLNEFVWPGEHIFPVPGGRPGQYDYGTIPNALLKRITERIERLADGQVQRIDRETAD